MPSFVSFFSFLCPSVLDLRVRYVTDRRRDNGRQCIMPLLVGMGITTGVEVLMAFAVCSVSSFIIVASCLSVTV